MSSQASQPSPSSMDAKSASSLLGSKTKICLLGLLGMAAKTAAAQEYIKGSNYEYCASNNTAAGDPCKWYVCNTNICVGCATIDGFLNGYTASKYYYNYYTYSGYYQYYTAYYTQYTIVIDDNTAVCGKYVSYSGDFEQLTPSYSYYSSEPYYDQKYTAYYNTYTQEYYTVASTLYYLIGSSSLSACDDGGTYTPSDPTSITDLFLYGYTLGCNICASVDASYFEEFFTDNDIIQIDYYYYLTVYPYVGIRQCQAGNDGDIVGCGPGEYYNTTHAQCQICACKFTYCIYCTSTECLLEIDDLSYYNTYTSLLETECDADPCYAYETGTTNCKSCPSFSCIYDYSSDSYECNYYSYLIVDSTTTVCSYESTYTDNQRYCYAENNYYKGTTYYGISYNTTATKQTINVICIACDLYMVNSAGKSICSDNCTNSQPASQVEYYINEYSVGCGVCASGYIYQELISLSYLSDVYVKTCAATIDNTSCSIIEYYNPYYNDCQRCACKFTDCAACTMDECLLQSDTSISTSNCTYHDPCTEYENNTNNCMACKDMPIVIYSTTDEVYYSYTYKLLIIDSNTTICATYGLASQFGSTATNHICGVLDSYYENKTYYGNTYFARGTHQYCIACDIYFNTSTGVSLCEDDCYNLGTSQTYLERSISLQSVGCGICNLDAYLYAKVLPVKHITGLYLTTCEANLDDGTFCQLSEYYDSKSGTCRTCSDLFDNCAACNATYCLICAQNFYYSTSLVYDYSASANVFKTQCFFEACPLGYGILDSSQVCQVCSVSNCLVCALNTSSLEYCSTCVKGYSANTLGTACIADSHTQINLNFFIKTGATYTTLTANLGSYYNSSSGYGASPSTPYYFIQSALYNISQMSITHKNINATIYVGKGDHFFFFCDTYQVNGNSLTEYCDNTDYAEFTKRFLKAQFHTDDIILNVVALDCGYASVLGMTGNSNFTSMCVNLQTSSKPTIYVNQAYAYFNLYGASYFSNLKFTGVNQFVKTKSSIYQMSTLPIVFCKASQESTPTDTKLYLTTQTVSNLTIEYYCQSSWTSFNNVPSSTSSTYACSRNDYTEYYESKESTLICTGEPDKSDFFYEGDSFTSTYSGIQPKRRNTLFNVLAFPEYQSISMAVPSLSITSCDFEYFLDGYDSLINIDNDQVYNVTVSQNYQGASSDIGSEDWEFFIFNGGERGVKLSVQKSTFIHSQFSKGLIVYRKQPYIAPAIGIANLTYLYMITPLVEDTGSYINLQDCYFYNLNFLTNVTALAIYGGSTVYNTFYSYLSTTTVEYPQFLHKGIVLNVEDYGGYIEIQNCTFLANMHFIPEILITNHSSSITQSIDSFKDVSITAEYKMAYCYLDTDTDRFFFQNGISQDDDIDAYYDDFERLSLIYISRNRGNVIIRDSNFTENIGTFGGAININSMDRQYNLTKALVVIYGNTFTKNMAYFSGNAIYIRNTKSSSLVDQICGGGILISDNSFVHNIGMKVHNGGAVSVTCTFIGSSHQDYYQMSSTAIQYSDTITSSYLLVDTYDGLEYEIYTYIFYILRSTFTENYSGLKGTAVYLNYISYPKIELSEFTLNGPVFSYFELLYSPYVKYFSSRTMTYYDEYKQCLNEFSFLSSCISEDNYIDFSHVQGALYVGHCELQDCIDDTNTMQLSITGTKFANNQAGPVLNEYFPNYLASQLFIEGGFYNYLSQTDFDDNDGQYFLMVSNHSQQLIDYFPSDYFNMQSASLITIQVDPVATYASTVNTFQTDIEECQFKDNNHFQVVGITDSQQYEGSLIKYVSYYGTSTTNFIPIINIYGSFFYDNQFTGPQTSLIYVNNGILYFDSNTAQNNGKITSSTLNSPTYTIFSYNSFDSYSIDLTQKYGIIKINGNELFPDSLYHIITSNSFTYSFSEFGSVYTMFLESQYAFLQGNTYKYNFASKQGSILNALGSISQSLIVMEDEDISYQFSLNGTLAVTSFNLNTMSLIVNNTVMTQFYSTEGSAVNLLKAQKVIFNNCIFKQNTLTRSLSTIVKSGYDELDYILSHFVDSATFNSLVVTQITSDKAQIYIDTVDGSSQNDFYDILTQSDSYAYASHVEANNCQFMNLYAKSGSVFYVTNSKLKYENDENSIYGIFNCSQIDSGVVYVENNGYFVGLNLIIQDSYSVHKSSTLLLNQYSSASFNNSQFINNYAGVQGTAIVEGSSSFSCNYCTFLNNFATDSSVIFADNNPDGAITISNSHFENNTATNNLFYMIYTTSFISTSKFLNNIAQKVNHGFTISNSELTLDTISVDYTDPSYLANEDQVVDTGFININFYSVLNILGSSFNNVRAKTSGVLYATGSSSVSIDSNSVFSNIYAQIGSVLYLTSTDVVSISKSSFINNTLTDVWLTNANATMDKNYFYKGDQQFIYASSSSIEVTENTFENGQNTGINGKAIYCQCVNLTVVRSTFNNLQAAQGGALYITSGSSNAVFHIHDNIFTSNQAQEGGAIYIQDSPTITIWNNSFSENAASVISPQTQASSSLTSKGQGGAIFYNCLNTDYDLDGNCNVTIEKNNSFQSNTATNDGGAIIWITNNFIDDGTNIFKNNEAYYGSDIASYPKELQVVFQTNNDYYNPVSNTRRLNSDWLSSKRQLDSSGFDSLVSGTAFAFLIYIYDQQGNVYNADSTSVATLSAASSDTLLKNNIITALDGVYNFSDVLVYSTPGSSISLSLSVAGLETYGNDISFVNTPIGIDVTFRSCVDGEEYTSSSACVACPNNTYAYTAPTTYSSCSACSSEAVCYGKNITAPLPGYWRANGTTESWVTCPRPASCLGGNETNSTGVCLEGYEGTACGVCETDYSVSGAFTCAACPERIRNIIQISFIMAFAVGYVAYLVKSTMQSANKVKPLYTVYLKIMTNHFQIIGAISNIDFDWPNQIQSFYSAQVTTSAVSTQVFSFDCFLFSDPFTAEIGVYYEKLMFYAVSPLVLTLLSVLYWVIYCAIKKDYSYYKDSMISTVVVLLFLIHPNICTAMFSAFNCIELDGTYYLRGDVGSVCYQGHHLFYVFVVIIPSIVIWVIGIPLFALLCLYQNRNIIKNAEVEITQLTEQEIKDVYQVKMKYGFLFNGYNKDKYFWEILVLYRKIILIMTTVFLSVISPESQVLVALMVVIINMFAHIFYDPFYTVQLNKMEMYSLQVASITMYCGLFYITGEHYTYMENNALKWFFLICLIVPNGLFFLYWIFYMNLEVIKMVYAKNKKLFRIITCGCVDAEKFESKFIKHHHEQEGVGEECPDEHTHKAEDQLVHGERDSEHDEQNSLVAGPQDVKLDFKDGKGGLGLNSSKKKKQKKLKKPNGLSNHKKDDDYVDVEEVELQELNGTKIDFKDIQELEKQGIRRRKERQQQDLDDYKEAEENSRISKRESRFLPSKLLKGQPELNSSKQIGSARGSKQEVKKKEQSPSHQAESDRSSYVYNESEIEKKIIEAKLNDILEEQATTPMHKIEGEKAQFLQSKK